MKKKGYFFTMDSMLAMLMFVIIVMLIHLFYINSPPLTQLHYLSSDTIDLLSNTKIKDMDPSRYCFVEGSCGGVFDDINSELTVIEQLKVYDDEANRENPGDPKSTVPYQKKSRIEAEILDLLYPPQYNYNIEFGELTDPTSSKIVVVSRRLVGGVKVS